jgi:hypothetical protein
VEGGYQSSIQCFHRVEWSIGPAALEGYTIEQMKQLGILLTLPEKKPIRKFCFSSYVKFEFILNQG